MNKLQPCGKCFPPLPPHTPTLFFLPFQDFRISRQISSFEQYPFCFLFSVNAFHLKSVKEVNQFFPKQSLPTLHCSLNTINPFPHNKF